MWSEEAFVLGFIYLLYIEPIRNLRLLGVRQAKQKP
jgi:hypothetical protein